jgi:hypothetical protein
MSENEVHKESNHLMKFDGDGQPKSQRPIEVDRLATE